MQPCGKLGHWKKDCTDANDSAKSDAKPENHYRNVTINNSLNTKININKKYLDNIASNIRMWQKFR